jgi:hypothetical protein
MCRKVGYATEREAQVALVGTIVARNCGYSKRKECRWYLCPSCKRWVLTSKTTAELRSSGLIAAHRDTMDLTDKESHVPQSDLRPGDAGGVDQPAP